MTTLQDLNALDLAGAEVTLWTIKGPTGPAANAPKYSGRWVETTDEVDDALKATFVSEVAKIEEVLDYSLLAQNNEASALQIPADETHSHLLLQEIAAELPGKKATQTKHLQNSAFYAAKFVIGEQVVWAVRKTEPSWKTKNALSVRNLFFTDQQLTIDDRPHFEDDQDRSLARLEEGVGLSDREDTEASLADVGKEISDTHDTAGRDLPAGRVNGHTCIEPFKNCVAADDVVASFFELDLGGRHLRAGSKKIVEYYYWQICRPVNLQCGEMIINPAGTLI